MARDSDGGLATPQSGGGRQRQRQGRSSREVPGFEGPSPNLSKRQAKRLDRDAALLADMVSERKAKSAGSKTEQLGDLLAPGEDARRQPRRSKASRSRGASAGEVKASLAHAVGAVAGADDADADTDTGTGTDTDVNASSAEASEAREASELAPIRHFAEFYATYRRSPALRRLASQCEAKSGTSLDTSSKADQKTLFAFLQSEAKAHGFANGHALMRLLEDAKAPYPGEDAVSDDVEHTDGGTGA